MRVVLAAASLTPLLLLQPGWLGRAKYFEPSNRLTGLGVSRVDISDEVVARRTDQMIDSQTFAIMRDPQALAGAERITGPRLRKIFEDASRKSGLPVSFISAVAYLESWGNAKAESPAGPKGIMQVAAGTARAMGLKITYAKRYRTVVEKRQVKGRKGKPVTKSVRRKIPYTVLVRDERLIPEKAVPAAAQYLGRLERRYGGRDWAVWAYHCGEGCTSEVRSLAEREGIREPITVPRVFFGAHPGLRRELYQALENHMDRDYSPTYWFRIRKAEQLLDLYRSDPAAFRRLFAEYRNRVNPDQRAPHRLSVWLKPEDLAYRSCEDLKRDSGRGLVRAFDRPDYFGFALRTSAIAADDPANREWHMHAAPAAIGTIAYVAFETRRLHEAMRPRGERFVPIEITALVQPQDYEERATRKNGGRADFLSHCSGQVFDIDTSNMPPGQREALEFVLKDMGWDGYLGFLRENGGTYHVGAAPAVRDFFLRVYNEAAENARDAS